MSKASRITEQPSPQEPQRISRSARAYAQNRSLGVVVMIVVIAVLSAAIVGSAYLAGVANRSGNMSLARGLMAVFMVAIAAFIYLSVPFWGGKHVGRIVQRLYAGEGRVALSHPDGRKKVWGLVLGGCFGACILASFVLEIPVKYMQPISALYVVPFLTGLWLLRRPMVGYAALLWPLLYGLHAILIVAGAPILITGRWDGLNLWIPIAGYGLLSGVVGHLHSRAALSKLKRLTRADLTGADQPEDVTKP